MGDVFIKKNLIYNWGTSMLNNSKRDIQSILKKIYGLGLFILSLHTVDLCGNSLYRTKIFIEEQKCYLPDGGFQELKGRVIKYLANSWCSAKKAEMIMDLVFAIRPQVCVEIGVFNGSSVLPIAATLRHLNAGRIYAIDSWSNTEAVKNIPATDPNFGWWSHVDMDKAKNKFTSLIKEWNLESFCSVIHATSELAVQRIPEIDFLHLDGNFCEENALKDVELFLPKVQSGGYILLSNLFQMVDNQYTKMSSMWRLFDECEIIYEIDNSALFRKN